MSEAEIDALVVHSHSDLIGCCTRWFADIQPSGGYPTSIVFPLKERMTVVNHGPFGGEREVVPDDPLLRGVGRVLTTPSFSTLPACDDYDADLLLDALRALHPRRVGIVAPAQ